MPTKKDAKSAKPEKSRQELAKEKIKQVSDEVIAKAKELKGRFDQVDPDTRKKIVAGLAAAAAGLVALAKLKRHSDKKKK